MSDHKIKRFKAFRSGFFDAASFLVRFGETDSLEERRRRTIASYDPSYLRQSGDLERIGRDMKKAFDANAVDDS